MIRTLQWINDNYPDRYGSDFESIDLTRGSERELIEFVTQRYPATSVLSEFAKNFLLANTSWFAGDLYFLNVDGMRELHERADSRGVLLSMGFLGMLVCDIDQAFLDLKTGKVVITDVVGGLGYPDENVEERDGQFIVFGEAFNEKRVDQERRMILEEIPETARGLASLEVLDELMLKCHREAGDELPGSLRESIDQ